MTDDAQTPPVTHTVDLQPIDPIDPAPPKPGYKTTEFWFKLAAVLLSTLFASGALTNNTALAIAGMAATVLTALGYTVSRTMIKTAAKAGLLLLIVGVVAGGDMACLSASQKAQVKVIPEAAKDAVVECVKQDAVPILALIAEFGVQAAMTALHTGEIDWDGIESAAIGQGKITGGCALAKFVASVKAAAIPPVQGLVALPYKDPATGGREALSRIQARYGVTYQ